jgi:hypothetical protein
VLCISHDYATETFAPTFPFPLSISVPLATETFKEILLLSEGKQFLKILGFNVKTEKNGGSV